MSSNESPSLSANFLAKVNSWTYHASRIKCRIYDPLTNDFGTYTLTNQALTQIHPALPSALAAMAEYRHRTVNSMELPGPLLACQVAHLCHPQFVVDDHGETQHYLTINELCWNGTSSFALASGQFYVVMNTLPASPTIPKVDTEPYVGSLLWHAVEVPITWLETQYPGWVNRYHTGLSLGYDEETIFDYACATPAAASSVTLPEFTLD